ncbi:hypothetical protein G9P44_002616 [Scheffersomyces stipitis]|nr:hypothetical protein G9P44_002616 [Scheffersomyces stipitis]
MSLVQSPAMFNNHHHNASYQQGHLRSRSYNEMLTSFNASSASSASSHSAPGSTPRPPFSTPAYIKKRSHSDLVKQSTEGLAFYDQKRSRTAPPSPPYEINNKFGPGSALSVSSSSTDKLITSNVVRPNPNLRSRSLSPSKKFSNPLSPSNSPNSSPASSPSKPATAAAPSTPDTSLAAKAQPQTQTQVQTRLQLRDEDEHIHKRIRLPSISAALQSTKSSSIRLKPVITPPTVSLDYFDTYKPNDENWRYELLDTINKDSKYFHLNQYNYLNKYATSAKYQSQSQSQSINSSYGYKPNFDSRISSKITNQRPSLPSVSSICHEKKINFPFESNYTYLNKTYMNDVEKYPEYLELAQSLIQLSQPRRRSDYHDHSAAVSSTAPIPTAVTPPTSYSPNSSVAPPPTRLPIVKPSHYSHQTYTEAPVPVVYHPSGTITPPASRLPSIQTNKYNSYPGMIQENNTANSHSPELVTLHHAPVQVQPLATPAAQQSHKFIPITPPSSKSKSRTELLKSPPKHHYNHHSPRVCISCGSDQSPCWRPSWSIKEGQLCNSCGLRYKKTSARCLNNNCKKIPAKGEWSLMQSKGKTMFDDGHDGYSCLECGWRVEIKT